MSQCIENKFNRQSSPLDYRFPDHYFRIDNNPFEQLFVSHKLIPLKKIIVNQMFLSFELIYNDCEAFYIRKKLNRSLNKNIVKCGRAQFYLKCAFEYFSSPM
jgi:hypothetical protein